MRSVHDLAHAVDDVRWVIERVLGVEGKELVLDRHRRIAGRGNVRQQGERAAELGVEHGAGEVVAALRVAAQEEAAAKPRFRLVDRDVRAGHARVPDEICGRGQSAEPTADDMRLHRAPFGCPFRQQYSRQYASCHLTCVTIARLATSRSRAGLTPGSAPTPHRSNRSASAANGGYCEHGSQSAASQTSSRHPNTMIQLTRSAPGWTLRKPDQSG